MKPCFRSFGVVFGVSGASEEAGGRLFRPSSRVVTHCVPGPKNKQTIAFLSLLCFEQDCFAFATTLARKYSSFKLLEFFGSVRWCLLGDS